MSSNLINRGDSGMLPNSIEAEQAVIGAILVDADVFHKVLEQIDNPLLFYKKAHKEIFNTFISLSDKSENIDILTTSQHLKDRGLLDEVGGLSYLSALTEHAPIAANAVYYAKILKQKAILRKMITAGNDIVELGQKTDEDIDELVDKAEQLIFGLAESRSKEQLIHISNLVQQSWKDLELKEANKGQLAGVNTGFFDLNAMTSGLQKSELIILAARPAMGKCLHKDSEILLEDGSLVTIEDVFKAKTARILNLEEDWKFSFTEPSDFIDDGIKPVFELVTKTGRSIKTTITHPFLTINGWKKLGEIEAGAKIAAPRKIDVFGNLSLKDSQVKVLAYLIGDGCLTKASANFTNSNPKIQEDFIQAVVDIDPNLVTKKSNSSNRTDSFRVSKNSSFVVNERSVFAERFKKLVNDKGLTYNKIASELDLSPSLITHWNKALSVPNETSFVKLCQILGVNEKELVPNGLLSISKNSKSCLTMWLEELGINGRNSHTKLVPDIIFRLNKEQISLFLNRLFATDGWASLLNSGQGQIGYSSVSKTLISQVQHLLLRFGVISSVVLKNVKYNSGCNLAWQLNITHQDSIKTFIEEIGIFSKEDSLKKVQEAINNKKSHSNTDLIPIEVWKIIEKLKAGESWASLARRAGIKSVSNIHPHKRALSRTRLLKLAKALKSDELINLGNSDVYWDEVVSISYLGEEQVYDLTIPETHNFVANDICVHNTSLALNIAENIAVDYKKPVAIFSLEMGKEQLVQRLMCSRAEVDSSRVRSGQLHADDWAKLGKAMAELGEAPIYIDDSAGVSVMELRGKCRRLQAQCGGELGLIVVDYLQLLEGKSSENRINQISEISRGLKLLAREINVPVLALSQLSRAVESRQDKRPMLSDLRESGSIEQDSDIVMFIYRDDYYNQDSEKAGIADVIISKHRSGPTGTFELLFQNNITKFKNPIPAFVEG
jgi:replicative DNA helicase